jgi:hypothetical protein
MGISSYIIYSSDSAEKEKALTTYTPAIFFQEAVTVLYAPYRISFLQIL